MLVLSRQRDETIMIGDEVEITVVDIRGDKVRLGITAPRSIQVHRKEVYDAIKRENQQAAKLKPRDVSDVVDHDAENHRSLKPLRDAEDTPTDDVSRKAKNEKNEPKPGNGKKLDDPQPSEGAGWSP